MPTLDELKQLCSGGETRTVEFKVELSEPVLKDLSTDLAAMANTEGGLIVIGVDDGGNLVGFTRRPRQEDRNRISAEAKNCNPLVQVDFQDLSFGKLEFLIISVQTDATMHQDKSRRFPYRVGDSIVPLDTAGVIAQFDARGLLHEPQSSGSAWGDWMGGRVHLGGSPSQEPVKIPRLTRSQVDVMRKALESDNRTVQDEGLEELRRVSWSVKGWRDQELFAQLKRLLKSNDEQRLHLCMEIIRGSVGLEDTKRRNELAKMFRDEIYGLTMPPASIQTMMDSLQVLKEFRDKSVIAIVMRWAKELTGEAYKALNLQFVFSNFKYYGYMQRARTEILSALTVTKSDDERTRLAEMLKNLRQHGG